jgi:hypothetical protein
MGMMGMGECAGLVMGMMGMMGMGECGGHWATKRAASLGWLPNNNNNNTALTPTPSLRARRRPRLGEVHNDWDSMVAVETSLVHARLPPARNNRNGSSNHIDITLRAYCPHLCPPHHCRIVRFNTFMVAVPVSLSLSLQQQHHTRFRAGREDVGRSAAPTSPHLTCTDITKTSRLQKASSSSSSSIGLSFLQHNHCRQIKHAFDACAIIITTISNSPIHHPHLQAIAAVAVAVAVAVVGAEAVAGAVAE